MRLQILDAAVRLIEEKGERALRLRDVAASVGIAEPTLYHYFPNRDALVVAAHAQRYRTELAVTVEPFLPAVQDCKSKEEFITILQSVFVHSFNPERAPIRATRAEVIGSAYRRESLRREVSEAMMDSLAATIEALKLAQSRGWLRNDVDPRAFAIFNLSLISGLIFPEIQSDDSLLDQWKRLAIEAATALATGEPSPDR
jgi:AcrR family transcriptional regulator